MLSFGEGADFGWLVQTSDSFFLWGGSAFFRRGGILFFSVFSLDFLGEAKKVRLFGESGFFYWGFGGIQAVKAGIFLRFLLHIG